MYRMQQLKNAYRKPEARFSVVSQDTSTYRRNPTLRTHFSSLLLGSRWYRAIRSFGWNTCRQRIGFTSVSASLSLSLLFAPSRFLIVNRRITKRGLASCLATGHASIEGFDMPLS